MKNREGENVEFTEKAKVRIEHWIGHNDRHEEEYQEFAGQLEDAGQSKAADHIRNMIEFTKQGTDCLRKTLDAIENG